MGPGRLLRPPWGLCLSLFCDLNKLLTFQGSGFLTCEIVRESLEWSSSHSPNEAPCKEKLLEHLLKEPPDMFWGWVLTSCPSLTCRLGVHTDCPFPKGETEAWIATALPAGDERTVLGFGFGVSCCPWCHHGPPSTGEPFPSLLFHSGWFGRSCSPRDRHFCARNTEGRAGTVVHACENQVGS